MTECEDVRLALGALAVGALEPEEERRVREHLEQCRECAPELDELSDTVAALALVDPAEIDDPPQPSRDMLGGLQSRVHVARRRRRVAAVAAAAAAAVIAGSVGFALGDREPDPPVAESEPAVSASGSAQGIELQVDAWDRGWGTALEAEITGVPSGYRCSLVAVGSDGSRQVAATWAVPAGGYDESGGGRLSVAGAVGLRSWDVDRYELVTLDGDTLVTTDS